MALDSASAQRGRIVPKRIAACALSPYTSPVMIPKLFRPASFLALFVFLPAALAAERGPLYVDLSASPLYARSGFDPGAIGACPRADRLVEAVPPAGTAGRTVRPTDLDSSGRALEGLFLARLPQDHGFHLPRPLPRIGSHSGVLSGADGRARSARDVFRGDRRRLGDLPQREAGEERDASRGERVHPPAPKPRATSTSRWTAGYSAKGQRPGSQDRHRPHLPGLGLQPGEALLYRRVLRDRTRKRGRGPHDPHRPLPFHRPLPPLHVPRRAGAIKHNLFYGLSRSTSGSTY